MMMAILHTYLTGILLFLASITSLAQTPGYFTIEGIIIDKETKAPLENASIGITNQSLGTISNANGQFILKVPVRFRRDSLFVAYLGYTSVTRIIADVVEIQNLVFRLVAEPVLLQEVTIQETGLSAESIIEKAVERI